MIAPWVVFVATYLLIASRRAARLGVDRPSAALIGAVAMVVVGALPTHQALAAVNLHVLCLLLGVLIIAAYLTEARFFRLCAFWVLTRTTSARSLLWGLTFVAGALSALLVNDTVCIVLTPLVVAVIVETGLPPLPYLLALASATNLGGVVSFSGNPQNMIIGAAATGHVSYAQYLALALPIGAACLAVNAWLLTWMFATDLPAGPLPERSPPRPAFDRRVGIPGLIALAAFALMATIGIDLAGAAITAAAALILTAGASPRKTLATVDWQLLIFFAGLFVVVAGFAQTGALASFFDAVAPVIAGGDTAGDAAFVGLTVAASNLVSNVPLVVIAVDWVPQMSNPAWGFVLLAIASTLAGNLTLFGSVANIIVMESAGPRGEISFLRFLRHGAVLTAASLVVAFGLLWLERAVGYWALLGL
jgi:Na+/H+ antiporter NhaD/arsenite permease-like protein